ncbi:MAG: bifunctional DNA primase/polymerase [Methanotrichaceae archaeon]
MRPIEIPPQLQNSRFRFIKLSGKIPKEKYWDCMTIEEALAKWSERNGDEKSKPSKITNYAYGDPTLIEAIKHGNYGIICGVGDLAIFDADDLTRLTELGVMKLLPPTFTVQSQPNHAHKYYYIKDFEKVVLVDPVLKDPENPDQPLHLADFQGKGAQCVAPNCIHHTRLTRYNIIDPSEIVTLDISVVDEIKKMVHYDEHKPIEKVIFNHDNYKKKYEDPFENLRIEDVFPPVGNVRRIGREIQGAPPTHSSKGGKAFRIFPDQNVWYCDAHKSGGGIAAALAVKYNIIRCEEAKSGCLRGRKFIEVQEVAMEHGIIPNTHLKENMAEILALNPNLISKSKHKTKRKIKY